MVDLVNLEAWAITEGYDPDVTYSDAATLPPGYVAPNFREAEFACNHCGALPPGGMDGELIATLQAIRSHYGVPVIINSGYRCRVHNANVGGAPNSQHRFGKAADFVVRGVPAPEVFAMLDRDWQGGLGRYASFTHIDTRGARARWSG